MHSWSLICAVPQCRFRALVSTKMLEDNVPTDDSFGRCVSIPKHELGMMERNVCSLLGFRLYVSQSEFSTYWFSISSSFLMERSMQAHFRQRAMGMHDPRLDHFPHLSYAAITPAPLPIARPAKALQPKFDPWLLPIDVTASASDMMFHDAWLPPYTPAAPLAPIPPAAYAAHPSSAHVPAPYWLPAAVSCTSQAHISAFYAPRTEPPLHPSFLL